MHRTRLAALLLLAAIPAGRAVLADTIGSFATTEKDFGTVERGSKLAHSFAFTNNTGREIRIRGVRVSCNCTTAQATSMNLGVGESASIEALMDTSGFTGHKSVTIFVTFDRPKRAEVALRVTANSVTKGANQAATVNEVDLGVIGEGEKTVKKINLEHGTKADWAVQSLDYGSPHVGAAAKEVLREKGKVRYELTVELLAGAPAGVFQDQLQIHTNDPIYPTITVLVKAQIQSKLSVSPETLKLEGVAPGQKLSRNVIVRASKPFKILRLEEGAGMFEAKFNADARTSHVVNITLTTPSDLKTLPDHVELVTDIDGGKEIVLPVQH